MVTVRAVRIVVSSASAPGGVEVLVQKMFNHREDCDRTSLRLTNVIFN